jgi:hypothetical protein
MNDGGDVAFSGHVAGDETVVPGFPPQSVFISTLGSLYFRDGATGQITSIAHAGDAAPGGGVFRQATLPIINNRGDVLFTGDLTPAPAANQVLGVFLYSGGTIIPIARPGDTVPGGGHIVTTSVAGAQMDLNNQGDVVFNASLDTDLNGDGVPDTGLFQWSHGELSLIARSGTVLPGVGTVANLDFNVTITPPPPILIPNSGAVNNDRGQVLFGARLEDGRSVMILYTPMGDAAAGADKTAGDAPMQPEGVPTPNALLVSALQGAGVLSIADVSTHRAMADQLAPSHPGVFTVHDVNSAALPTLSAGAQGTENSAPDYLFALPASVLDDPLR